MQDKRLRTSHILMFIFLYFYISYLQYFFSFSMISTYPLCISIPNKYCHHTSCNWSFQPFLANINFLWILLWKLNQTKVLTFPGIFIVQMKVLMNGLMHPSSRNRQHGLTEILFALNYFHSIRFLSCVNQISLHCLPRLLISSCKLSDRDSLISVPPSRSANTCSTEHLCLELRANSRGKRSL